MDQDKFSHLIQFDNFVFEYEQTYQVFEEDFRVVASVDRLKLSKAYCVWLRKYYEIKKDSRSAFNRMVCLIGSLIEATATIPIIEYKLLPGSTQIVSDRFRGVLVKYPNQITALSMGSNIYSLAMQRHSNLEPSCALTPMEVEIASRKIIANPKDAYKFRNILNLKRGKGGVSTGVYPDKTII